MGKLDRHNGETADQRDKRWTIGSAHSLIGNIKREEWDEALEDAEWLHRKIERVVEERAREEA